MRVSNQVPGPATELSRLRTCATARSCRAVLQAGDRKIPIADRVKCLVPARLLMLSDIMGIEGQCTLVLSPCDTALKGESRSEQPVQRF